MRIIRLLILVFFSGITYPINCQQEIQKLISKIKEIVDSKWKLEIDSSKLVIEKYISHNLIEAGSCIGMVEFYLNDSFEFSLFVLEYTSEKALIQKINDYHMVADCALTKDYDTYFTIIKYDNLYAFLPMYPCWSNGYSSESKYLIRKLAKKIK